MTRTFLISLAALAAATSAAAADLTVTFDVAEPRGQVMVALYGSEAAYDGDKSTAVSMVPAAGQPVSVTFKDLAPGRYAVKSFHDVNGDGKMGTNPLGMPTEPFGFSNNAPVRMGPPAWADAAFDVDAAGAQQTISLK